MPSLGEPQDRDGRNEGSQRLAAVEQELAALRKLVEESTRAQRESAAKLERADQVQAEIRGRLEHSDKISSEMRLMLQQLYLMSSQQQIKLETVT
jgi:hypothetical protein